MSAIDRQIIGADLCNCVCEERASVIHPETCTNQVMIGNSNTSIDDWLSSGALGGFSEYTGMLAWLNANYPKDTYTLPVATYVNAELPKLGGVFVDPTYLTISPIGVLSVNISSLNIPTLESARYGVEGIIRLGNDTPITGDFSNTSIEADSKNFPLRVDSNGRAGVAIPKEDFTQTQSDWNQADITAVDYIKNKPTIPTVNNATITLNQGNITKGTITLNQSSDAIINFDEVDHVNAGSFITNGLHANYFRVGKNSSSGSYTANKWVPLFTSHSYRQGSLGKCSVIFEVIGREDSKTFYGKYYLNHMYSVTNKLLCLSFYSEDTDYFAFNDIRVAKYTTLDDADNVLLTVYKKVRDVQHSMFIVNILAENSGGESGYSDQHYFSTQSSVETGYQLTNTDLRIGTLDSNNIIAGLNNDYVYKGNISSENELPANPAEFDTYVSSAQIIADGTGVLPSGTYAKGTHFTWRTNTGITEDYWDVTSVVMTSIEATNATYYSTE